MAPNDNHPHRFQFHLSSLFIGLTAACIGFALLGRWGIDGLLDRVAAAITLGTVFIPFVELYQWWKDNGGDEP